MPSKADAAMITLFLAYAIIRTDMTAMTVPTTMPRR